jgi:hypothetical protein
MGYALYAYIWPVKLSLPVKVHSPFTLQLCLCSIKMDQDQIGSLFIHSKYMGELSVKVKNCEQYIPWDRTQDNWKASEEASKDMELMSQMRHNWFILDTMKSFESQYLETVYSKS